MATLMSRNHDSDSLPVKVTSDRSCSTSVKSLLFDAKFHRLAAAYVRAGGISWWAATSRKGTAI
jgi:hypothetical protein